MSRKPRVMNMERVMNKGTKEEKAKIRRFLRIDYPVYCLPVEIKERTSEPYEEIERNMVRLIKSTEINTREQLFKTMGIAGFSSLSNRTLDYLLSINHVDEVNGVLSLTQLGRESLDSQYKIKEERSSRLLYFDALQLHPLPSLFYHERKNYFLEPIKENHYSLNVVDVWNEFPEQNIKKLLQYDGRQRNDYNIPQEMIDIVLSADVRRMDVQQVMEDGVIMFTPLYAIVEGSKESFARQQPARITQLKFTLYSAIDGKPQPFFEGLIKQNMDKVAYLFDPLFAELNFRKEERLVYWHESVWNGINSNQLSMEKDGNLSLKVNALDVDQWIANHAKRPLLDVAYDNVLGVKDKNYHGRVLRIIAEDAVREKAIKYILDQKRRDFESQEKSNAYISEELVKIYRTIRES